MAPPDVFVSYSRADQAFVRDLVERLSSAGKEAWVDWEGIPPTAAWLGEIEAAIEHTGAFLFVISPSSAASRVCREELTHAERLGKRIIPVTVEAVDPSALPSALADRQWISFCDGRTFDECLATLVEALDTDLEWVRGHTQWLGKAREWERSGRDKSFLLRGSELRAAEAWLTTPGAAEKEPATTPLQTEYVFTSRQAAARRQRSFVTAVSVALLVTVVLAVAALLQRNRAIAERKTAVSELLANLSVQRLPTDLDRALLLGAAAYEVKRTPAAANALLVGVHRTDRVQGLIRAVPGELTASDLSGNGRVLVAATGREISAWDVTTRRLVASISMAGEVGAVAVNRDGSTLATIEGSRIAVYRVTKENGLQAWDPGVGRVARPMSLAFSPSGSLLAVGTRDGRIGLLDLTRGRRTILATGRPAGYERGSLPIRVLTFTEDGRRLAAGSDVGIHTVDLGVNARYRGLTELGGASALAFTAGGQVAVVTGEGRLVVVDTDTRRRVCGPSMAGLTSVGVGPRGRVVTGGRNGVVQLADSPCAKPGDRLTGHGGPIELTRFAGPSSQLLSVGDDGLVVLWGERPSTLVQHVPGPDRLASDIAWGSTDGELVIADNAGVWRVDLDGTRRALQGSLTLAALASAPTARVVAAYGEDGIQVWRGAEYSPDPAPRLRGRVSPSIALSADATLLAAGTTGSEVRVLELAGNRTGERRLGIGGSGNVTALAFGDGSRLLAAGDNTGRLVVWTFGAHPLRTVLATSATKSVASLAFAPSEALLAIGWSDGGLALWDLEGAEEIQLPTRHQRPVTDLEFSPTGERLVSADASGVLFVWDVTSARPLGHDFEIGIASFEGLDASSAGVLAAIDSYGSIAVVQPPLWDAGAASARVCDVVRRSLTDAERRTLVSGLRLPATCSQ